MIPAYLGHASQGSGLSGARHPSIRLRITTAHSPTRKRTGLEPAIQLAGRGAARSACLGFSISPAASLCALLRRRQVWGCYVPVLLQRVTKRHGFRFLSHRTVCLRCRTAGVIRLCSPARNSPGHSFSLRRQAPRNLLARRLKSGRGRFAHRSQRCSVLRWLNFRALKKGMQALFVRAKLPCGCAAQVL